MKNFNKSIIAVLIMAMVLTGCGENSETPENSTEISENSSAESVIETEEETTGKVTRYIGSEATAKIEELRERVKNYGSHSEKEGKHITIVMTEYHDDDEEIDNYWEFFAVNDEYQIFDLCSPSSKKEAGRCVASPDGDTKYYTDLHSMCGTHTFYAIYNDPFDEYDIDYYIESEPVVIDESTIIKDTNFYGFYDSTTAVSLYYFNCSNLLGDAKYEISIERLDAQLAEGRITEEEYNQKKAEYQEYYKN